MTIAESIAINRRYNFSQRIEWATNAEWMANLARMFCFEKKPTRRES